MCGRCRSIPLDFHRCSDLHTHQLVVASSLASLMVARDSRVVPLNLTLVHLLLLQCLNIITINLELRVSELLTCSVGILLSPPPSNIHLSPCLLFLQRHHVWDSVLPCPNYLKPNLLTGIFPLLRDCGGTPR